MTRIKANPAGSPGCVDALPGLLPLAWQLVQLSEKPPISLCLSWISAWLWHAQQDQAPDNEG